MTPTPQAPEDTRNKTCGRNEVSAACARPRQSDTRSASTKWREISFRSPPQMQPENRRCRDKMRNRACDASLDPMPLGSLPTDSELSARCTWWSFFFLSSLFCCCIHACSFLLHSRSKCAAFLLHFQKGSDVQNAKGYLRNNLRIENGFAHMQ